MTFQQTHGGHFRDNLKEGFTAAGIWASVMFGVVIGVSVWQAGGPGGFFQTFDPTKLMEFIGRTVGQFILYGLMLTWLIRRQTKAGVTRTFLGDWMFWAIFLAFAVNPETGPMGWLWVCLIHMFRVYMTTRPRKPILSPPTQEGQLVAARWLGPHENPFGVEILDCRQRARTMTALTGEPRIAARFAALRNSSGEELRGVQPKGARPIPCSLSYPHKGQLQQGRVFKAQEMEDKWDIYLLDDYLHFSRSWTGDLVFQAKVESGEETIQVDRIETASSDDDNFVVLQVDFLIKSHVLGQEVPHPLPEDLRDVQELAVYSFQLYGRRGLYGSFGDTSRIAR